MREHRVGGGKEAAEDEQHRQPECGAAAHGSDARASERPRGALPGDLGGQEARAARERAGAGRGEPGGVLGNRCLGRPRLCAPECAETDRTGERKDVRRGKERRVVPRERGGEDEQRQRHPTPALVQWRPRDLQQQCE